MDTGENLSPSSVSSIIPSGLSCSWLMSEYQMVAPVRLERNDAAWEMLAHQAGQQFGTIYNLSLADACAVNNATGKEDEPPITML